MIKLELAENRLRLIEVIEEFGCSACSPVWLRSQAKINTCTETHLTSDFHAKRSVESIRRELSKSGVD